MRELSTPPSNDVLDARLSNVEQRVSALEEALTEHIVEGIVTKEIPQLPVVQAVAQKPDRAWFLLPPNHPDWREVRELQKQLRISAVRSGVAPAKRADETVDAYEKRIDRWMEVQVKESPAFEGYLDAAGNRDPWTWIDGLRDLAEEMDGEPSQFVVLVKKGDGT